MKNIIEGSQFIFISVVYRLIIFGRGFDGFVEYSEIVHIIGLVS